MYKNYIVIILTVIILLSGCSSETSEATENTKNNNKDNEVGKNDSEVDILEVISDHASESEDERIDNYSVEDIHLGDILLVEDKFEFTLQNIDLTTRVEPPNKDNIYSYYEVEDDDVIYLDVVIDIKNINSRSRSADDFLTVRAKYEETYEYYGFSVIEEKGGGDFTYTGINSIDPLKTRTLHYIVELPEVVEDNPEEIKVIIDTEHNEHYHYKYQN